MQKFHERFGIEVDIEEGKRRFVNRARNFIFDDLYWFIHKNLYPAEPASVLAECICSAIGERLTSLSNAEKFIEKDFWKCLIVLEALSSLANTKLQQFVKKGVEVLLAGMEVDIGIRWNDGHFLKAGAPVLDDALVNDPLNLLNKPEYKGVSDAFQKGLDHFLHSLKRPELLTDVLTNMHEALEAMAKIICPDGKDKDLSGKYEAFISKVGLTEPYKKILKEYILYANKFARHAAPQGKPKSEPSRKEVEAFVYLTGLFIRIALSENS